MSDDSSKKENIRSRARTVISSESNPPGGDDAITVAELPLELFANVKQLNTKKQPPPRHTAPVEQSSEALEIEAAAETVVPVLSDKLVESIRRANSSAKYVNDYVREVRSLGIAHFQQAYPYPFIVGLGLVGEIDNIARSSREQSTREVLISDVSDIISQSPVLASRVWPLKASPNIMGVPGVTIGRSSRNDVVITEFALSTVHCRFTQGEDHRHFSITDLESKNGTLLN
ncbi:MAG: FHA domain-containing protein [Myxococcota bacterium]|nr:FHA domain-containing protein [Myxococcota bacterium]